MNKKLACLLSIGIGFLLIVIGEFFNTTSLMFLGAWVDVFTVFFIPFVF